MHQAKKGIKETNVQNVPSQQLKFVCSKSGQRKKKRDKIELSKCSWCHSMVM